MDRIFAFVVSPLCLVRIVQCMIVALQSIIDIRYPRSDFVVVISLVGTVARLDRAVGCRTISPGRRMRNTRIGSYLWWDRKKFIFQSVGYCVSWTCPVFVLVFIFIIPIAQDRVQIDVKHSKVSVLFMIPPVDVSTGCERVAGVVMGNDPRQTRLQQPVGKQNRTE